jgi:hypothetical protein
VDDSCQPPPVAFAAVVCSLPGLVQTQDCHTLACDTASTAGAAACRERQQLFVGASRSGCQSESAKLLFSIIGSFMSMLVALSWD